MTSSHLPRDARLIALILASKGIQDTTPQVLLQLMEFAHRYTTDVLLDSLTYSEHAGKGGKLDLEDIALSVQGKVNYGFREGGERDFLTPIAHSLNSNPLPPVPETAFIRLPHPRHMFTAPNFNLIPNKPPPGCNVPSSPTSSHSSHSSSSRYESDEESDPDLLAESAPNKPPRPNPTGQPAGERQLGEQDDILDDDEDEEMMMVDEGGQVGPPPVDLQSSGIGEKRRLDADDDDYEA